MRITSLSEVDSITSEHGSKTTYLMNKRLFRVVKENNGLEGSLHPLTKGRLFVTLSIL